MLDAVLVEWEGVLAETGTARRDALLRALADEGVPCTAAMYDSCCAGVDTLGAASAALARAGIDDPTLAELVARRASRAFRERLGNGFSLAPGAAELIASAAAHTRVAIVTRADRAETDMMLALAGLGDTVAAIVTRDDVTDAPPAPALYLHALSHLARNRRTTPARIVALSDAAPSIRSARACGLRTIAAGAAAHVAVEADAAIDDMRGVSVADLARLAGVHPSARRP